MPMNERKHRCGGALVESSVILLNEDGSAFLNRMVPGYLCTKCGDKLIDYQTAAAIQKRQTTANAWTATHSATTKLDAQSAALILSSPSTAEVRLVSA